jgi:GT2 family glycosyltransferase/2-polyprenyl-3-methyl-5-hydroxy-6-metoxy-1,4-benzoquinol methylase
VTKGPQKPAGVLVSGVVTVDTGDVGSALAALGLVPLVANQTMDDLANRVLAAAGGSWAGLPQISPSEFARLGDLFAGEAQSCLRDVLDSGKGSENEAWVWADPTHSLLAPFWHHALGLELSIVHVHRDPLTALAAISTERHITAELALEVWERYSRAALVSCGSWPSVVIGPKATSTDPAGYVRLLSDFLDRIFGARERALDHASRIVTAHRGIVATPDDRQTSILTSHRVLDQILRELEGVINDRAADAAGTSPAFAHLSELYDSEYYAEYDGGVPYTRSEPHWIRFFAEVADNIVKKIAPKTSFDAGCAIGMLVEALRERGVDARGVDFSSWAIDQVPEGLRPYCQVGSITEPIEGHYDLITCIEVLEHLPASEAETVIDNFCAHADSVLFSSTPDDFDDPTHLNVETTSYWAELFARRGFFRDPDHDAVYLAPQAILFRKSWGGSRSLVSDYERALWHLNEAHASHSKALEEGWNSAAARVEDLERLLIERPGLSDERTVDALERLVGVASLRSLVAGPTVTGEPEEASSQTPDDYARWRATREVPEPPTRGPSFSIVVPVFDPVAEHLTACIRSVRAQTYADWELVLVNVSQAPHVRPICERFEQLDPRVSVVHFENAGIAANTHIGVQASHGEWVVFLDHDDTLEPHALAAVAGHIEDHPDVDFVYSDEDKLSPEGCYVDPFFKPDWSPDLLLNLNYICHLVSVSRTVYEKVGGLRSGFEGAQDYDFVLRATAASRHVGHVADVLYNWRQHENSTASDVTFKPEAHSAGRRALDQFTRKHHPGAWLEPAADRTSHRVRYPLRYEKVSIIIPFRDHPELTDACVRSIAGSSPVLPMEVLLVSNQSREEATFRYMQEWQEQFSWADVIEYDKPFNFQSLNNWTAGRAQGALLLFMNNDVEVLHRGWLEALAENAQRAEIGAVGPRLFYPDGLVQHAGVALGIGGLADHPWARQHPDTWTPAGPSYWTRDFLAVTAACLMVEHAKFDEVNGFDERFEVCGGDVDLCLRLFESGYWNLMTPFARLTHHESVTRPKDPPEADVRESLRAYAHFLKDGDPFFNRNLSRSDRSCRIATPSIVDPHEARL